MNEKPNQADMVRAEAMAKTHWQTQHDFEMYLREQLSKHRQAAIAAHNAFIRGAADKSEVKEAGARAVQERFPSDWDDIDPDDQREAIEWAEISFHAMLDQIERTQNDA